MARSVVLGNGGLTVGLDERGFVHDFYYPYVGLENLTTARMQPHHIGIWVDGSFSWLSDAALWDTQVDFEDSALVSTIKMRHKKHGIELLFRDFVDCHYDIFARKITVRNTGDTDKQIRLFFHQVFQISALGRSDTAVYVPDGPYMMDYKGRCTILAYAEAEDGTPFDQYAAGNAGIEGKEGTFRDAEDGELSMSPVEHAGVDSTIRVSTHAPAHQSTEVRYWLAVADSQDQLEELHQHMLGGGFMNRLNATYQHWQDWLSRAHQYTENLEPRYTTALRKSLMTIKAHTDKHGGIIASCDSSIYNYGRDYYSYVWPRDGAYVMWPLIKLGYTHEPRAFFRFCHSTMNAKGYLAHKYQPDRAIGSTWHPLVHGRKKELAIQEDETATVIYMLIEYIGTSKDMELLDELYDTFIKPACNFMTRFVDEPSGLPHASYDLWEEKFISSTYTASVTYAALMRASKVAEYRNEHHDSDTWKRAAERMQASSSTYLDTDKKSFIKGFLQKDDGTLVRDNTLDISSFYGAWRYRYVSIDVLAPTLNRIETELLNVSPSGGAARYENDGYFRSNPSYKGNPWFVTTLWLAQYYAANGRQDEAKKYIDWSLNHALPSGLLSEQISPENGAVVGVAPLVWSHAELINTMLLLK